MKIRTEFAVLLLLITFVLVGVIYGGFETQKQQIINEEREDTAEKAGSIAASINERINDLKEDVELQSRNLNLDEFGTEDQRDDLKFFINSTGFSGVSVISRNGTMVGIEGVEEESRREVIGKNFSYRTYFKRAIQGEVYVSERIRAETGNDIIVVSAPIRQDGKVTGVLSGSIHLDGENLFGNLKRYSTENQRFEISFGDETVYSSGPTFDSSITSSSNVESMGWEVRVERNRIPITSETRRIAFFQGGAVLAVIVTVVIFGFWEYRTNIAKVRKLLKGFDSLEKGNYEHQMVLTGSNEWNQIGEEFNQLGETLERRESELKEERDRFAALFENVPDPVISVVFEGNEPIIESVNPEFEKTFGYESDEVEGISVDDLIVPPEYEEEADELNEQITQGYKLRKEVRRGTSEGVRDFLLQVVPFKVGEETTKGYAVYTDITERKQRQRRLQVLNRVLRHDLRNSMSVVMGNCEILKEEIDDPDVKERIEDILERANELMDTSEKARWLEESLEHSRRTRETVDLVGVVEREIEKLRNKYPEANIDFETEVEELEVYAERLIDYAVENIIENGVEHNERPEPEVEVHISESEDSVEVEITDNGPGIPDREVEILTGVRDITQTTHGSGLGLWIVNWIVTQSAGGLEFSDNEPRGSVVTIRLKKAENRNRRADESGVQADEPRQIEEEAGTSQEKVEDASEQSGSKSEDRT